jgi:antitoxin (DNA-binding transcriptional repressor) of toxin-antitoxin stability system
MEKVIKATDLRVHTREIIESARFRGERFIVQAFGKPVAIIMGIEEYQSLIQSAHQAQGQTKDQSESPRVDPSQRQPLQSVP